MLVVLTETYCNKVNIQITQRDFFIQKASTEFIWLRVLTAVEYYGHDSVLRTFGVYKLP